MSLSEETKPYINQVATESLHMLAAVAARANSELQSKAVGSAAFASVNTLTSVSAMRRLDEINLANLSGHQLLAREPAIARVVVVDESGNEQIYYICRAAPVSGVPGLLASRNAPVGRLASLPVGAEFSMPNGSVVEVIERALLRPWVAEEGWDSRNTVLESGDRSPVTIESLRALLRQVATPEHVEDLLIQLVEQAKAAANVFEGIKRNQITKMGLRDQPVLDQYQDEIFRLPLDQRLLILGPPGTGKTTTLIRRLGQKLDASVLSPEELRVVSGVGQAGGAAHVDSWIMFTPTELLKQYLKEAFAREHVPASDMRLKTWQDYRRELGRNTLGVLRTASSGGTFTLKDAAATLRPEATTKPTEWFAEFDTWQRRAFVQQLGLAAQLLSDSQTVDVASMGKRIAGLLKQASPKTMPSLFLELAAEVGALQALVSDLKTSSDAKINGALNLAMNRDPQFIGELAQLIDQHRLAADADADEQDEADELDGEDEDPALPKTGPGAAVTAYLKAVRAQARAQAAKRSISKTSRNAKIIEWLGPRTLSPADRATVGAQLLVLAARAAVRQPDQALLGRCAQTLPRVPAR